MKTRAPGSALITLSLILLTGLGVSIARAEDDRGGEVGVIAGATFTDEDLAAESGPSPEFTIGLRGGSVFARRWAWYIDGLYSNIGTSGLLGDARTVSGRSGFDFLFTPERKLRWFATAGAGWMVVDFENSSIEDFHRPLVSAGFGLELKVRGHKRIRWEIREDLTLDDPGLDGADVLQGHFLVGLIWGPGTAAGSTAPRAPSITPAPRIPEPGQTTDTDGDGVKNKRDNCPDTPAGAFVDDVGCPLDADLDGVPDGIDTCPATRTNMPVDDSGCPSDSDGDGVQDGSDACGGTPQGAVVDEWGCPKDSDRDEVLNGLDRCPSTPFGARVDADGCPQDGDGDGVYDGLDRCPDSAAGERVDARGCAVAAPVFERGRTTLVLEGVNFTSGSATPTREAVEVLNRVARSLVASPGVRVEIAGHTDSSGTAENNQSLSEERAAAVRDFLIHRGVDTGRLVIRGYGESRPIETNETELGRAKNRRVELKKLD